MSTPSIHSLVTAALTPVLPNSWAVELPPIPVWPAIVFDIESKPEDSWVFGGGYDQHHVNVVYMALTVAELDTLQPAIVAAFEAMPQLMHEDDSGDADYEPNPQVYARYITFVLRTPR